MIRVVISDDHPFVRSGFRHELRRHSDIELVGEALNGDDTPRVVYQLKPDILLLDIHLPAGKAVEIVRELKERAAYCRILVVSADGDVPTISGMLKAGVNGYMLKGEDPVVIAEAIRAVLKGDIWLSPGIAGRMASTSRNVGAIRNSHLLTRREMEVLQALATGITTREIAIHLRMAERTVEFHITNILRKLEVKGRLAAAMKAKELGIL